MEVSGQVADEEGAAAALTGQVFAAVAAQTIMGEQHGVMHSLQWWLRSWLRRRLRLLCRYLLSWLFSTIIIIINLIITSIINTPRYLAICRQTLQFEFQIWNMAAQYDSLQGRLFFQQALYWCPKRQRGMKVAWCKLYGSVKRHTRTGPLTYNHMWAWTPGHGEACLHLVKGGSEIGVACSIMQKTLL